MIDKRLQAYRKYQRFLRIQLTICGCWYMPTKSGKPAYCWSVCTILAIIMYLIMSLHLSYIARHNFAYMIRVIGVATGTFSALLKMGIFLINRNHLINYHRTLSDLFEKELMQNENIRTTMFSLLCLTLRLGYTYFTILSILFLIVFAPLYILIIRHLLHFQLITNYTLPLSRGQGYFWTVPDNFLYNFYLLFESGLGILSAMTASSVDSVFGFYVYLSASTLRAMTFRLMNPLPTEKFSDLLKTCVAKHQALLRCCDILEHIYRPIILWHFISNAAFLCSVVYGAMALSEFKASMALEMLAYSTMKLLQTFMYTWYGTILTSAGEDFRKGIYFSKWPNSDLGRHMRTNIILIMMQKPMTINAFFIPVDIVMFTNFVNTSVSYFFLLQSIGDKGG